MALAQPRQAPESLTFLPFSLPWIGEEEIDAVVDCLRSGWLTTGPKVREFEAAFANVVGARYALAVNSCTAALHLALDALGIRAGDQVLVPTMTFAATAEVVRYLGARPVLLDCDPHTLNLCPDALRRYLEQSCVPGKGGPVHAATGERVRAVVPVHYAGLPCDMERIGALAAAYQLEVVEDAAHALPAAIDGRAVGTLGRVGAFSFYATKNITTGEGGMITTDDGDLADRMRMMSLHGISRDAWNRYTQQGSWYYEILEPGYKYNMTDLAAALGREQLRRSDALWEIRRRYAARYTAAFRACPEILPPPTAPPGVQHAWHLYVIRLDLERLTLDRAGFIDQLKAWGIGASVHFIPLHLHPYYRATYGYLPEDLPVAAAAYERLVSLPLYPRMRDQDLDRVIDTVFEVVERHRR
jgi:dTDP-4-amino-4,6-dideoxygalactose transaminase